MKLLSPTVILFSIVLCKHCVADHDTATQSFSSSEFVPTPFYQYPASGGVSDSRIDALRIIQKKARRVSAFTYLRYLKSWNTPDVADSFEKRYETLRYLRKKTDDAITDIQHTRIESGLICWHFYNMGYVFKTPYACFGIDLHFRYAEKLAPVLDFLLTTHAHHDHYNRKLLEEMLKSGKPIISDFYPEKTSASANETLSINNTTIKTSLGDHHRHLPLVSTNNMLMFQIDADIREKTVTIYHTGDANGIKKMQPDRPVDLFIVHVQLPMPLSKAVYHVKPAISFASHIMELSHSDKLPLPLRWNYDYGFRHIKAIEGYNVIILAWGERWVYPGSTFITFKEP